MRATPPPAHARLVIVGIQPIYRGGTQTGRDAELRVREFWPGAALFLEKPISNAPVSEVADLIAQLETVVSVGYMLRYLRGESSKV